LVQELFGLAAGVAATTAGFAAMIGLSSPQYTILVSVRHLEGRSRWASQSWHDTFD